YEGIHGAVCKLRKIIQNIEELNIEEPDLFDDEPTNNKTLSLVLEENYYLDKEVGYILELVRYTFNDLTEIVSEGSALVYAGYWKNTRFAIKTKEVINQINEIHLTGIVNPHPNIIQFCGVTKLKGETNYSLFAKEIAYAISWLHVDKKIVHSDLHPSNILVHNDTIKLADFGRSRLKESDHYTKVFGIIPYMDPKSFETHSYVLTEKSDIYSLGVILWELTCVHHLIFKIKIDIIQIKQDILKRENPISETNIKLVTLYKKCWKNEPAERLEYSSNNFRIK
ncbi:kinase-like protein, partial [Rhizophagus irregularis]